VKSKRLLTLIGSVCLILVLTALLIPACAKEAAPTAPSAAEEALRAEIADVAEEAAALEKELEDAIAAVRKELAEAEAAAPAPGVTEEALRAEIAKVEEEAAALKKELAETEAALEKKLAEVEAAAPVAEEVYNWIVQCCYVWEDPQVKIFKEFIDEVREKSGGRINIIRYAEAEIVPVSEVLDAVGKGVVDMGHGQAGYWSGEYPVLTSLNALYSKEYIAAELQEKFFSSGLYDVNEEAYNEANTHLINMVDGGEYPALYGNAPISTVEDLQGLKMRFNPPYDKIFERLGAKPTWFPGSEMYMALKLGTLDVASWDCTAFKSMKWEEVAKYYYRPCVIEHCFTTQYFINLDVWNPLPDDLKDIIATAGVHQYYDCWDLYGDEMAWVDANAERLGYEIFYHDQSLVDALKATALEVMIEDFAPLSDRCARAAEIIKTDFLEMD